MEYEKFAAKVREAGLVPRDCGNGHYRIEGGRFEVNWYPFSKRRTIYINGLNRKTSSENGSAKEAIEAALAEPIKNRAKKAKRKRSYRAAKLRLLKKDPHCYWCGCDLTAETMTADHKIPLALGGSNGTDNLVLACEPCNKKKDSKIWYKEKQHVPDQMLQLRPDGAAHALVQ